MAASSGRADTTMTPEIKLPDMELFQRLRLLEIYAREQEQTANMPIGYDYPLHREFVDICTVQSLEFPHASCIKLEEVESSGFKKAKLHIACFGLTGPSGVMPLHYTEMLSERSREKDTALRTLFDGFNARATSFLYRAWKKARLPLLEERASNAVRGNTQPTKSILQGYTGLRQIKKETPLEQETEAIALHFSGYYSKRPRNANSLQKILSKAFGYRISVQQFQGRWFDLEEQQLNIFGQKNCELGQNLVIGSAVYEGAFSIRLRTEALSLSTFKELRPGTDMFKKIQELLHLYIGQEYWVDLQVVLKGSDRPALILGVEGREEDALKLGEGLWLSCEPAEHDVADTIYEVNR